MGIGNFQTAKNLFINGLQKKNLDTNQAVVKLFIIKTEINWIILQVIWLFLVAKKFIIIFIKQMHINMVKHLVIKEEPIKNKFIKI